MPLVTGATHALVGTGTQAIGRCRGLAIALTSVPASVGQQVGTPPKLFRLGRINLGTALGFMPNIPLEHTAQLVYPIDPEYTLVGYTLLGGVHAQLTEIPEVVAVPAPLMPWDRAATVWQQNSYQSYAGNTSAAPWTYTVPAGKILMVAHAELTLVRATAPGTLSTTFVQLNIGGVPIIQLDKGTPTINELARASLSAGPLYLPAGTIIAVNVFTGSTGGSEVITASATGTLFSA